MKKLFLPILIAAILVMPFASPSTITLAKDIGGDCKIESVNVDTNKWSGITNDTHAMSLSGNVFYDKEKFLKAYNNYSTSLASGNITSKDMPLLENFAVVPIEVIANKTLSSVTQVKGASPNLISSVEAQFGTLADFVWVDGVSGSGIIVLPYDRYKHVIVAEGNWLNPTITESFDYYTSDGKTYVNMSHFSGAGGTLYDEWNTGDDTHVDATGIYWRAQTFTASDTYMIKSVRLKLLRTLNPGVMQVYIRAESGDMPSGGNLSSNTTVNANTFATTPGDWYEFILDPQIKLTSGVEYAIVISATNGDGSNMVGWRVDSSTGYASGRASNSSNSGGTWALYSAIYDFMFEVWGDPATVPPTVTTGSSSSVEASSATVSGNITVTGGENADGRGFAWGSTSNITAPGNHPPPASYSDNWTGAGSFGIGIYNRNITGLSINTTYYYRAYAHNSGGWGWGDQDSFKTDGTPLLTSDGASNITGVTATLSGNVTYTDGANLSERGFEWGTSTGVYNSGNWTEAGNYGIGIYSHGITALSTNTTYFYRAYGINPAGTGYATENTFETVGIPLLTSDGASSITGTTATLEGSIVDIDGELLSQRGFEWGTSTGVYSSGNWTESGSYGIGAYSYGATSLSTNTTYFYRAYGINSAGTGQATEDTFETVGSPCMITTGSSNNTTVSMTVGGDIICIDGETLSQRGFQWTIAGGIFNDNWTEAGAFGIGDAYSRNLIYLSANTTYDYRAIGYNSGGWGYSDNDTFTTDVAPPALPGPPLNFTATDTGTFASANLTWIKDGTAITTVIRGKADSKPIDVTDGFVVYDGPLDHTINDGLSLTAHTVYYRAWSYNALGYSLDYAETSVGGESMQYILLFGLIAMAGTMTFFAFKTTAVLFRVGAAAGWLTVFLWVLSEDRTVTLGNHWVTAMAVSVFCLIAGIMLLYMGKTIDKGWIMGKEKDNRSRGTRETENYKQMLKDIGRKYKR